MLERADQTASSGRPIRGAANVSEKGGTGMHLQTSPALMPSDMLRDRFCDLLEAVALRSDRSAFAELFEFYAPRVKGYLVRLGAPLALAEELAQETLIQVWRKADTFDRRLASVSTWIFRIARNRRIDAARRSNRPELDAHDPAFQPAPAPMPFEDIDGAQREAQVRRALAELPDDQRRLLDAAFYEGLTHREISQRFDLPLGTVKSRIRLAFQKLKARLDPDL